MKQQISIYGEDRTVPIEIRESFVRDGIVRYKKQSFKVFENNGLPSILANEPITHPLHKYTDDEVISRAMQLLEKRIMLGPLLESPEDVKKYLMLRNKDKCREVFSVIFLNHRHHVVSFYDHSQGDISSAAVYPAVIIQEALRLGADTMVLSHNHPSACNANPSSADRMITRKIKEVADVFSMKVLDHIITAGSMTYSFAENAEI